jgi:ABC-type dipeptide/oligopeptide/nickel transport system permease subunit
MRAVAAQVLPDGFAYEWTEPRVAAEPSRQLGLGFLGLGAQPPLPEWGAMISTGRQYLLEQWWVATMPGIAILIVSLGFNLLGDGLRDVLDPRQR